MTKPVPIFFLILCFSTKILSQSVSIFNIDASDFPNVKANFYAMDKSGMQIDPDMEELSLTENGELRTIIKSGCPPPRPPRAISAVLMTDISGSMSKKHMPNARAAAKAWISALPPNSECALASFNHLNFINRDFTKNKPFLLSSLEKMEVSGGTDFDNGLYNPAAGALEISRRGKYNRIILFITDGTSEISDADRIIREAKNQACPIFCITLGMRCPASLKRISIETGGKFFESITTEKDAVESYLTVLQASTLTAACQISWNSKLLCDEALHKIELKWQDASSSASYLTGKNEVAKLSYLPRSVIFSSVPPGKSSSVEVIATAENASFEISGISSESPFFDISPKEFFLAEGESITLKITYSSPDSSFRRNSFAFRTGKCEQSFTSTAYFPGFVPPPGQGLTLTSPNGKEIFVAGADTMISWGNISPSDDVSLEFSHDAGKSWRSISSRSNSNRHLWRVPSKISGNCLVRVSQLSGVKEETSWVRRSGGIGSDISYAVACDINGYILIGGGFTGQAEIGDIKLKSNSGKDFFFAKYSPDGDALWANTGGGNGNDNIYDVMVTAENGCAVTGNISHNSVASCIFTRTDIDGNNLPPGLRESGTKNSGVALCQDHNGNIYVADVQNESTFSLRDYSPDMNGEVVLEAPLIAQSIAAGPDGSIYVTGCFGNEVNLQGHTLSAPVEGYDIFIMKVGPSGQVDWLQRAGSAFGFENGKSVHIDKNGDILVTGYFGGEASFGGVTLKAAGQHDIFTAKYSPAGQIIWATKAGGNGYNIGKAVSSDKTGNIFTAGYFTDKIFTENDSLSSRGGTDIVLMKHNREGKLLWIRQAGGKDFDYCHDMTLSPEGDIYLTGDITGAADFGNISTASLGSADIFLWKLGEGVLQSDVSDATFAIVMPEASAADVDMGMALTNSALDSVVDSFVLNQSAYPLRIDSIFFEGTDAQAFSLVSGIPPYSLGPGGYHPAEFRFEPLRTGPHAAVIVIITQADTLRQNIIGGGAEPLLAVDNKLIDFGNVSLGQKRDSLAAATVKNNGSFPLTVTSTRHAGPNDTDFLTLAGQGPFVLQPEETARLDLRFLPSAKGRTSGQLLFEYDGTGSPAIVQLFGEGRDTIAAAVLQAPIISADAGQTVAMPIRFFITEGDIDPAAISSIDMKLRFNPTLLEPASDLPKGHIAGNIRTIDLSLPFTTGTDSTLAILGFTAALGNDSLSFLQIEGAEAKGGGKIDITVVDGEFRLNELCYSGGARLINPDGRIDMTLTADISGNSIDIKMETIEKGMTALELFDLQGNLVSCLIREDIPKGKHSLLLDTRRIPAGVYFVRMSTPSAIRTDKIVIRK